MTITGSIQIAKIQKITGGRSGKRDYGRLWTFSNGTKIYLAKRKRDEVFCCGKPNVSEAVREGVAEWAIDNDTLITLRTQVVDFVGICEEETGDIYLTTMAVWMDPTKFTSRNYASKGGALQRYVNFTHFKKLPAQKHLTAKAANKIMKAKGWSKKP